MSEDKEEKAVKFLEKDGHYELWFMDLFKAPGTHTQEKDYIDLCDITIELMHADITKELHVFIWSYGGDIDALATLLQLIRRFRRTVAVNLGVADSCGWVLFFSCNERYAAPNSEFLYHEVKASPDCKIDEISMRVDYLKKRQKLMFSEDVTKILTDDEKKLGKTSEIFLTGEEIIERGGCKDFSFYDKRIAPQPTTIFSYDNKLFKWENGMMRPLLEVGFVKDETLLKYKDI